MALNLGVINNDQLESVVTWYVFQYTISYMSDYSWSLRKKSSLSDRLDCWNRNKNAEPYHASPPEPIHWLPIRFWIIYKLCVLMHHAPAWCELVAALRSTEYGVRSTVRCHHVRQVRSAYLSDIMTSVADLPGRGRLRSSSSFRYELPRLKLKFGERSFSFSGPKA